jgi:uncharacterized protein YndB with AHSA1/START domain
MDQLQTNQTEKQTMAPDTMQPIELRLERTFDAAPEMVFDAWVEREQASKWFGPHGYTVPLCEMDAQVGGTYRMCMREPDGTDHFVTGTYIEISRPDRLVYTWAWEEDGVVGHATEVTIELSANGDKTDLVLTHRGFESEDGMNGHKMGWNSSFESLDELLAA